MVELTVVIPTYRRPDLLARCLASLADQDVDHDRFQVVVVDDASGDTTGDVVAAAPRPVELITQPSNSGPAAARNRGVAAAQAPLVLFLDDDVTAAPDLLATHLRLHADAADPSLAILGRVDWHPEVRRTAFLDWLDRSGLQFAYDTWLREGPVVPPYAAFYTANLSLRRDLLEEVGGFDERFPFPAYEDMEVAFRLAQRGMRLRYEPAARAFHLRSIELGAFRARMFRVGQSAQLLRSVAPDFPLDDAELRARAVPRRRLVVRRALALTGMRPRRDEYYWAAVATAYVHGLTATPEAL